MKRIHILKDYNHPLTKYSSVCFRAGQEIEVEDDIADMAVVKGHALFSDFAEDDLLDRSKMEERAEEIRDSMDAFYDIHDEAEGEE